ncbi:MAG: hypothetical protein NUV74_02435 [Candidatus Brocadiaceae bacterium]|nr:hypothetical protein [Candidatus Brocadiaceae bacterium]
MTYKVIKLFRVKVNGCIIELREGQVISIPEGKAVKLVSDGRIKPIEPYITDFGSLVIPFDSDRRFHWWNRGQSIHDTLRELGASDEILKRYKSPYSDN